MEEKKAIAISRRKFFKLAAVLTGSVIIASTGFSLSNTFNGKEKKITKTIRLNPAFRIKNISQNEIELFTHRPDGSVLSHHFSGFEADLFRMLVDGNTFNNLSLHLAKSYNLSESKCQEKLIKSLNELEKGKLIYYGDKMIVKISETRFGN